MAFGAVGFELECGDGGDVEGGAVFLGDAEGGGLIRHLILVHVLVQG